MRVLVVTNLYPGPDAPQRGRFVHDQLEALRAAGVEIEIFAFPPGSRHYIPATRRLRAVLKRQRFDLVHAHYGLAGWCARLAGASPLLVTFHGTDVRHRIVGPLSRRLAGRLDLVAAVSAALFRSETGKPGLPWKAGASAVLPCGADLRRFRPLPRPEARRQLGLDPDGRYLLFPAGPDRAIKRHDRALEVASRTSSQLLTAGDLDPDTMPLWINAASAVLVPSDNEGFGLAAIEALACGVPVLSTPVGVAPFALAGIEGCLVAPFDAGTWARVAAGHLDSDDPRVDGSEAVRRFSAEHMAARVAATYDDLYSMVS